jgi:hypothetical protein
VCSNPRRFILSRIVGYGLGCMGFELLRDHPDTSQTATFSKERRQI